MEWDCIVFFDGVRDHLDGPVLSQPHPQCADQRIKVINAHSSSTKFHPLSKTPITQFTHPLFTIQYPSPQISSSAHDHRITSSRLLIRNHHSNVIHHEGLPKEFASYSYSHNNVVFSSPFFFSSHKNVDFRFTIITFFLFMFQNGWKLVK